MKFLQERPDGSRPKNESTLSKYLKDAEEGLRKYNVLERLLSIQYQIQRGVDIDTRELEVLDNIRTKILLKAEKMQKVQIWSGTILPRKRSDLRQALEILVPCYKKEMRKARKLTTLIASSYLLKY